jgi:hypothetical protein
MNRIESLKRKYRIKYRSSILKILSNLTDSKKEQVSKRIDKLILKYKSLKIPSFKKTKILALLEVLKEFFSNNNL